MRAEPPSHLEQSFYFNWTPDGQPVPIPVTRQCDTLHIKWSRGQAKGPNPTAPYTLQIYTSTFVVPFLVDAGSNLNFDWQVPFVPGTQYQICMFDKYGNTGGCEAIYTVIEPASTPSCTNITFPEVLDVEATVKDGPMSQFGWVDSCTDIQLKAKGGKPPYRFTAAPSLHPPWNLTAETTDTINWTVALSWASPFFVSMVDSEGRAWSNGPLHSGGMGKTACLNTDGETEQGHQVSQSVTIGSAIAALVVGLLGGILASALMNKRKQHKMTSYAGLSKNSPTDDTFASRPSHGGQEASFHSAASQDSNTILLNRIGQGEYTVEPFIIPPSTSSGSAAATENPGDAMHPISPSTTRDHHSINTHGIAASSHHHQAPPSPQSERPPQSVYVVHHDGGRAPVTVYTQDGTEVVELPPRYAGYDRTRGPEGRGEGRGTGRFFTTNPEPAESSSDPPSLSQERRPGPISKP